MDLLSQPTPFAVFVAIAAVGFTFLMISLFFGEIFEHFDQDFDHGGPSFFSTRVVSVFVTAFGAFGGIAAQYGFSPLAASSVGVGGGLLFGTLVYLFARFLYGQQASSDVISSDLVGQTARVVVAIPAGGVGQVRCRVGEELVDKIARARDGVSIAEHASVRIEEILGEVVVVKPN
jgi:membrane protein implicated in regulation of membrane protease activity